MAKIWGGWATIVVIITTVVISVILALAPGLILVVWMGVFAVAGIISLFKIPEYVIRLQRWIKGRSETRNRAKQDFTSYFREPSQPPKGTRTEQPKRFPLPASRLIASGFGANRELYERVKQDIAKHLQSNAFHIVNISGRRHSGKTVLLEQLASGLASEQNSQKIYKDAEFWLLREDGKPSSRESWEKLKSVVREYAKTTQRKLVLFVDDMLSKLPEDGKASLEMERASDFWMKLSEYFGEVKIIFVTALRPEEMDGMSSEQDYISDNEEFGSQEYVTNFPLRLSLPEMKEILRCCGMILFNESPAYASGPFERKLADFVSKPGIMTKCRGDLFFLQYLFGKFVTEANIGIHLPAKTQTMYSNYTTWRDKDKGQLLLFTSLVQVLGLIIPDNLVSNIWLTASTELAEQSYLMRDQSGLGLEDPFFGYFLIQEEFPNDANFSRKVKDFLDPIIGEILGFLGGVDLAFYLEELGFLRNLFHLIGEERYRPILLGSGRAVVKPLLDKYPISNLVRNRILPRIDEMPKLVAYIRRWASTLSRFGTYDEVEDLYSKVLQSLKSDKLSREEKVKILIPTAGAMSVSQSPKIRDQARQIYDDLLFGDYSEIIVDRSKVLDMAVRMFLDQRQPDIALNWFRRSGVLMGGDPLFLLDLGRAYEMKEDLPQAKDYFERSIKFSKPEKAFRPHRYLNSLHRYALFVIRYFDKLPGQLRPKIEDVKRLIEEVEGLALDQKMNVHGIYMLWGEFHEKVEKEFANALENYKKAVSWCEDNALANPRPYVRLADFLIENASELGNVPDILAQAEAFLHRAEEAGIRSTSIYNVLGRLVGGTTRAEPYKFQDEQEVRERPNFGEALDTLEKSFESDVKDRFDLGRKTWQDIRTHGVVKDVLIKKSGKDSDKCGCLQKAQQHFRAAFEGLPRPPTLDNSQVRGHVVEAMVAYADFLWERMGKEGCLDLALSKKDAEYYYEQAVEKAENWNLNSVKHDCYYYYALFIWNEKVDKFPPDNKRPLFPLSVGSRNALLQIVNLHEKALLNIRDAPLSKRRADYLHRFSDLNYLLSTELAALVGEALRNNDKRKARELVDRRLSFSSKSYDDCKNDEERKILLEDIKKFRDNRFVKNVISA